MSSSEGDDIWRGRRSADAGHVHSPSVSGGSHASALPNGSADNPRGSDAAELNGDDDVDLFGSGSGGEESEKYF
jgi:hypothetical protein